MLTKRTEREEKEDGESSITTIDATTVKKAKYSSERPRKSDEELPILAEVTQLLQDRGGDISAQLVLENPNILDLELFKGTPFDYRVGCNLEEEEIERLKAEVTYPNSEEKKYTDDDSDSIVIHGEISSTYYESNAPEIALWLVTHWIEVKETLGKYYYAEFQKYCLERIVQEEPPKTGRCCAWWYRFTLNSLAQKIQTLRGVTLLYILKMV